MKLLLSIIILVILSTLSYSLKTTFDRNHVINMTKKWVRAIISKQGEKICPYTIDENSAGIGTPGKIRYAISDATNVESAHEEYWNEVKVILDSSTDAVSTTLLIYPQISLMENMDDFDIFSEELDEEIKNRDLESIVNNVYFHPNFKFIDKDGQNIMLFDEAGNVIGNTGDLVTPSSYARRSPWPIVNILRSQMVNEAQKFVPEGKIFSNNVKKLEERGTNKLQNMLDEQNWDELLISNDVQWSDTEQPTLNNNDYISETRDDDIDDNNDDNNDTDINNDDDIDINKYLDLADEFITKNN